MAEAIYKIETHRRNMYNVNNASTSEAELPESSLSAQESDYQEIFDAKVTAMYGEKKVLYQKQFEQDIGQSIVHSNIQFNDFQQYRGIIDIDGHSWSGRFGSLLCLNSVVLKIDPSYVEYFYARQRNSKRNVDGNDDGNNDCGHGNITYQFVRIFRI